MSCDRIQIKNHLKNVPLSKLAKRYRKEWDDCSSEDDVPLMELSKRIKQRDTSIPETYEQFSEDEPFVNGDGHFDSDNAMPIDAFNLGAPKTMFNGQSKFNLESVN